MEPNQTIFSMYQLSNTYVQFCIILLAYRPPSTSFRVPSNSQQELFEPSPSGAMISSDMRDSATKENHDSEAIITHHYGHED